MEWGDLVKIAAQLPHIFPRLVLPITIQTGLLNVFWLHDLMLFHKTKLITADILNFRTALAGNIQPGLFAQRPRQKLMGIYLSRICFPNILILYNHNSHHK